MAVEAFPKLALPGGGGRGDRRRGGCSCQRCQEGGNWRTRDDNFSVPGRPVPLLLVGSNSFYGATVFFSFLLFFEGSARAQIQKIGFLEMGVREIRDLKFGRS